MAYRIIRRPWRARRPFLYLIPFEIGATIALLALTAIAQTDLYRSTLWQIGFDHKMNSNPATILYAYANHQPIPHTPFVWSETLTDYEVAICVLSLFIFIAKLIATIMHLYYPVLGLLVSFAMSALYIASIVGQAGPDYTDSRYPSPTPWFLRKGCSWSRSYGAYAFCQQAQSILAASAILLAVYVGTFGLAFWSMLPNKALDARDDDDASDDEDGYIVSKEDLELKSRSNSPTGKGVAAPSSMPFTPRTQAFHSLERKLPLRG